jgi:uncharacterized membrane protein (UPF0127 family)
MSDQKRSNINLYLIVIMVIALVAMALIIAVSAAYFRSKPEVNYPAFVLNNKTYAISAYAYTTAQQEKGLMNATVTNKTFMLFVFGNSANYPFWMKNTYTPLDIMWVEYNWTNDSGSIVYAVNATPCDSYSPNQTQCIVYNPDAYANYVIETKAGFQQTNGFAIGSKIKFLNGMNFS